ncbi:MAG: hypothetical protein ACRECO_11320 [Xanthobacteraceae bacterium]
MNWKLTLVTTGCVAVLAGAAVASHHLAAEKPTPERVTEQPPAPPLFAQAATEAPARALWPRGKAVAYNAEMHTLLTMAATPKAAAREAAPEPPAHNARVQDAQPPREKTSRRASRRNAHRRDTGRNGSTARAGDTVEVEVRDRNGRRVRIERVEREAIDPYRARAYAPPPAPPPPRQGLSFGPFRLF